MIIMKIQNIKFIGKKYIKTDIFLYEIKCLLYYSKLEFFVTFVKRNFDKY